MAKSKLRKTEKAATSPTERQSQSAPGVAYSAASSGLKVNFKALLSILGVIAIAVLGCYANTLWMGTVFNDGVTFVHLNLQDPSTFFGALWQDAVLRPLWEPWTKASFALDVINYKQQFGWYHLVNIFLHFSACAALFCLVFRCTLRWYNDGTSKLDPYRVSAAAALLYACHPLAAQTATYISARYSSLGAANFLLALNFLVAGLFTKNKDLRFFSYALMIIFAVMCAESSEVILLLPATMLVLFFLMKPKATAWKQWAIQHPVVVGLLSVFTICCPFMVVNGFMQQGIPNAYGFKPVSTAAYFATQAKALATYYSRVACVPVGLSIEPPFAKATGWSDVFAICGAGMLLGLAAAFNWARRQPVFMLGLTLIWSGLLVHICMPQTELVADPVVYLSLSGFCLIVAAYLTMLWSGPLKPAATKFGIVVILLIAASVVHNLDFASDDALIAATLRTNPNSAEALAFSAVSRLSRKDWEKSVSEANQALALDPNLCLAYFAKGNALFGQHKYDKAEEALSKAQELGEKDKLPTLPAIRLSLAETYLKMHNPAPVPTLIVQAAKDEPSAGPRAIYLLGMTNYEGKNYGNAFHFLQQAVQKGVQDALAPLAESALHLQHWKEGLTAAQLAVRFDDNADSQRALGNADLALNDLDGAEKALTQSSKLDTSNAETLALLSILNERKGDKVLAESYRKDALKLKADVFSDIPLPGMGGSPVATADGTSSDATTTRTRHRRHGR